MDEKQRILICLGAATAANCGPCFRHYYGAARQLNLTDAEIVDTVEIGNQMKTGAMMAMNNSIGEIMGGTSGNSSCCASESESSCCG